MSAVNIQRIIIPNTMNGSATRRKVIARPHNAYNIFFILERARLIHDCVEGGSIEKARAIHLSSSDLRGYDQLVLPDLPQRYQDLELPPDWYVPGRNAKRKHEKTHGCE